MTSTPLLHDFAERLISDGFYKAAFPAGYVTTRIFLRTLLAKADGLRCLTVIEERDAHVYATVYDRAYLNELRAARVHSREVA